MKITALLLLALSFCYAQDLPVLDGRWNMDIENMRVLLREHKDEYTEEWIKRELIDANFGKDVVFKRDTVEFCNKEAVLQSYKYRLYYNEINILRIEILISGPGIDGPGVPRLYTLDLKGEQLVFRSTVDNKFELFMTYKRVGEVGK